MAPAVKIAAWKGVRSRDLFLDEYEAERSE